MCNSILLQGSVTLLAMETIGDRIRTEREAKGITRAELAKAIGAKGESYISELELGGIKKGGRLHLIAQALGVTVGWLETGKGDKHVQPKPVSDDLYADISGFAAAVGLSDGVEADDYAETYSLKFRKDSLRRKNLLNANLAVMYGKGDSMEPKIHDGDAVLFNRDDTRPRHEDLFVIQVPGVGKNDAVTVKQCEIIGDIVTFRALNPRGDHNWRTPRRMDDERHPIQIVGRVRWLASWQG